MSINNSKKGYRLERAVVNYLKDGGCQARRVFLSGAGEEKGDLVVTAFDREYRGECKSRAELPKWIVGALGDHDFVVLKQDRGETLVMIRLPLFRDLIQ